VHAEQKSIGNEYITEGYHHEDTYAYLSQLPLVSMICKQMAELQVLSEMLALSEKRPANEWDLRKCQIET
jgi:hypothetical protein